MNKRRDYSRLMVDLVFWGSLILVGIMAVVAFWPAAAEEWTMPSFDHTGKEITFQEIDPADTLLSIYANNEVLVTIMPDGTIEYGKNYTPDAAAKALWEAVGNRAPCKE